MLRTSIRSAIRNNCGNISTATIGKKEHHKLMRKEMILCIFPFGNRGTDPSLVIKMVMVPTKLFNPENFQFVKVF